MDQRAASGRLPAETPLLQLHLEPEQPLEVRELTNALGSLSRRYQNYIEQHGVFGRGSDARLLVWNVSPGSIDIALIPDPATIGGLLGPAYEVAKHLLNFGNTLRDFLHLFKKDAPPSEQPVSVQGCDDATNIVAPIANKGGVQPQASPHSAPHSALLTAGGGGGAKPTAIPGGWSDIWRVASD